jgi:HAD superfamily hydrolase (TIGR01549 family)
MGVNLTAATILLDLDDTLLGNDMAHFLPPYFASLARRLHPLVPGVDLRRLMGASVQVMQADHDPTVTNMAAFMADFSRRVGVEVKSLQPVLEAFYHEDYPLLRQYTTVRPEARQLVSHLLAEGHKVVIATNPFFPTTAIAQRLAWAGLDDFTFDLVTTMENSHFSKPDPRYYQEILATVGSSPVESWMVGDDPENDIEPAYTLGLKTWWISDGVAPRRPKTTPTYEGSLANLLAWVKREGLA